MYKSNNSAVIVRGARFMPCTLTDEESGREYRLNIKEPKLKFYKMFQSLSEDSSVEEIIEVAAKLLSANKENIKITPDFIEDNLSLDEVAQLFDDFSEWIAAARNNDPN